MTSLQLLPDASCQATQAEDDNFGMLLCLLDCIQLTLDLVQAAELEELERQQQALFEQVRARLYRRDVVAQQTMGRHGSACKAHKMSPAKQLKRPRALAW